VKRLLAILGSGIVAGTVSAQDATWHAAVPLWKSLSKSGQVVEAGPAPTWLGPKQPKPLAKLSLPAQPDLEALPWPRKLPETVTVSKVVAPLQAAPASPVALRTDEKPKPYGRESFASESNTQQTKSTKSR